MAPLRTVARILAIPTIAAAIMVASAGPASADGELRMIVQEVTGTVLHAETGLTTATGNVTGTVESIVFELSTALQNILRPAS